MVQIKSQDWGNLNSPWITVNLKLWDFLIKDRPLTRYPANHDIFWQDKEHAYVYIVASGRVRISILNGDDQQKHLYIGCTGAMLAEVACILSQKHVTTATTMTETALYCIPSKEVQALFHSDEFLADWLLQYEARKNRLLISQIMMLSFQKAPQRFAHILLCLKDSYGKETDEGIYLKLKFTCNELAAIANTSRVTSNNAILDFIHEGILEKSKGHYIIKDLNRLQLIADSGL